MAEQENSVQEQAWWAPFMPTMKFVFICILILFLLIPLALVGGVVSERKARNEEVKAEIAGNWGNKQTLVGPLIAIPYHVGTATNYAVFLPENLNIKGNIKPEQRYRGIYKTTVYTSQLEMAGTLPVISAQQAANISGGKTLDWANTQVLLGLNDTKGVKSAITINIDGKNIAFEPASELSGLKARIGKPSYGKGHFSITLGLNGNEDLLFAPIGKNTTVALSSNWSNPSFIGGSLPTERNVSDKGFDAKWSTSYFARNFPQSFSITTLRDVHALYDKALGTDTMLGFEGAGSSAFGVSLMTPVDLYHQVERATKYGILFLALTFLVYFLFEIAGKVQLHILQYTLVGLALCLFYLLLLALSEVLFFDLSYAIASIGTIGLITYYSLGFTKSKKQAWAIPSVLTLLYVYLYVLLQLEDLSLLLGAIGLFIAMAILMAVTRKINWFNTK